MDNELFTRIGNIYDAIADGFGDDYEAREKFDLECRAANSFSDLTPNAQRVILEAEKVEGISYGD